MAPVIAMLIVGCVAAPQGTVVLGDRLYDGAKSVKAQNISIRPWGSGGIAETNEVAFQGARSLRVSSRNYFQGGSLTFNEARDLADKFDDKSNVIRLTFFLADAQTIYGKDAKNKDRNNVDMGLTTVGHAASMNNSKPGELVVKKAIPFKPKIRKVRLIVTTTDGKKSEIYVPIFNSVSAGEGWRSLGIPLQSITGLERTNKTVKNLSLSTDTYATLYLGDVRVLSDTTPIGGEIQSVPHNLINMKLGTQVTLTGRADAGDTPLVYTWDFDDRDGIQPEAEGQQVSFRFRKKGEFNVTLTISDFYGVKQSTKLTLKTRVVG